MIAENVSRRIDEERPRMRLEEHFEFGELDAIRVKGRRIGLEHIVERYKAGASAEEIAAYFRDLDLETVNGGITYYLRNQAEVDAYLARIAQRTEALIRTSDANPSPAATRIRELKHSEAREQLVP
jgi:uncharacterized protein (DUF433 family)